MSVSISSSLQTRKAERPFFDSQKLPEIRQSYVAWLDLMGAQSIMRRSLASATNFVMKIHVSCQTVIQGDDHSDIDLYPMIDGVYIVTPRQPALLDFLKAVLTKLALAFIFEENPLYRFLVRGAIAFGPLIKGEDMLECSKALQRSPEYCSRVALGMPLTQAWDAEKKAAPFGIYIHESARAFAPGRTKPLGGTHWKWWLQRKTAQDDELYAHLKTAIEKHYVWVAAHPTTLLYESGRIAAHADLAREYFAD
jgi:hypothetical protein